LIHRRIISPRSHRPDLDQLSQGPGAAFGCAPISVQEGS
jgi:hypothetical protein